MGCQKVKEKHVSKNCLQGYSQAWNMSEAINISKLCKMKRSSNFCFIGCYKTLFYGFEGNNLFKYELHNQSLIMKWLWRYSTWEGGVYFLGGLVEMIFFSGKFMLSKIVRESSVLEKWPLKLIRDQKLHTMFLLLLDCRSATTISVLFSCGQ